MLCQQKLAESAKCLLMATARVRVGARPLGATPTSQANAHLEVIGYKSHAHCLGLG